MLAVEALAAGPGRQTEAAWVAPSLSTIALMAEVVALVLEKLMALDKNCHWAWLYTAVESWQTLTGR
jgi:hypothetical protein